MDGRTTPISIVPFDEASGDKKNMENARYAMNDDTDGFINQMKTQVGKLSMT